MSKKIAYTQMPQGGKCPACGDTLAPVKYYSARLLSQTGYAATGVTTSYNNIIERLGGLCPTCAAKKYGSLRIIGSIVMLGALILIIMALARNSGENVIGMVITLALALSVGAGGYGLFAKGMRKTYLSYDEQDMFKDISKDLAEDLPDDSKCALSVAYVNMMKR